MRKSILHAKLMALDNRLIRPRKEVKEELARCEAGLEGERKLLYYLSEIEGSARVLHDIRLPFSTGYTHLQMDTVVITQQMIFILDAKHFSGRLVFDRLTRQLRRGNVTYNDPITQVVRHKRGLEQWLDQPIPIMAAVVLTHPNVRIEITPPDAFDHSLILYAQEIPAKVHDFLQDKQTILTKPQVYKIASELERHNKPYDPDIMKQFQIELGHLYTGIQCPYCRCWSVERVKRRWLCRKCSTSLKNPHLPALKEYVRLFGTKAVNKQIRAFTGIQSESVVKKLLRKWAVEKNGDTKGRVYHLPEEWKWE
ncbi:NERD domain-containing protein [Domibacillus indicus]|uniref:nuclease-related domain-containing protein n=1 Tax=Domibacillus indicus TaxID=1437523 RepID=UPI00203B5956|nr:nuclease-related domain-containing protein [Domibacillus indicus]MCM3788860.1 NERD domain-containing protein [Domibacillus indicus]